MYLHCFLAMVRIRRCDEHAIGCQSWLLWQGHYAILKYLSITHIEFSLRSFYFKIRVCRCLLWGDCSNVSPIDLRPTAPDSYFLKRKRAETFRDYLYRESTCLFDML